jgi:hypothetical protein
MRCSAVGIAPLVCAAALARTAASAPTWSTSFLTVNTVDDRVPLVDGRYVAWHGVAPGTTTFHIFVRDLLTGGTQDAGQASTYFGSRTFDLQGSDIVYFDAGGYVIHYDIATGVTTNLTPAASSNLFPKVARRKVVWYSLSGIFLRDLDTGITTPLTTTYAAPFTDGSYVAWAKGPVFLYDIANPGTTPIASDSLRNLQVYALDAGRVLWVSSNKNAADDNNIDVYRIATGETTRVATGIPDTDVAVVQISGDNVMWQAGSSPLRRIHQFDLATGIATPVSNAGEDAYNPAVSDSGVAYTQIHSDGSRDIVHYDTASHAYTTLRTDVQGGASLDMYRSMVVWEGFRAVGPSFEREILWSSRNDDGDSLPSALDDCPYATNQGQEDANANGIGDACECGDLDDDGLANGADASLLRDALASLSTPLAPQKCSVIGSIDASDSDANGLRDDCNVVDWAVLERTFAAQSPGIAQVCEPAVPSAP